MRVLRHSDPDFTAALSALKRHAEADPQVQKTVQEVIHAVRTLGDDGLLDLLWP